MPINRPIRRSTALLLAGLVLAGAFYSFNSKSPNNVMNTSNQPRGIDHIGLTVPNVDEASQFLEKAFGAKAIYDVQPASKPPMAGQETEQQLGLPKGAKIVHMRLMRIENGPSIELFQLADTPQRTPEQINDFGYTHIGLYVDDIQAATTRFEQAGGTLLSPVHKLAGVEDGPGNAGVYGRAPWGSLIELLTYPGGIQYPDPALTRWTPPAQK